MKYTFEFCVEYGRCTPATEWVSSALLHQGNCFLPITCTVNFIKHLMWPLNITLHLNGFLIEIERVILNLIEKYKELAVAKVTLKWRTNLGDYYYLISRFT